MIEELKSALHEYYERQEITVKNFRCPLHSFKCEQAAKLDLKGPRI